MTGQEIFSRRLQRIAAQTGVNNATLFIGAEQQIPKAAAWASDPRMALLPQASLTLMMAALAVLSGALAWIWAQWLRASLSLMAEGSVLAQAGADLALALAAVFLLAAVLGLRGWRVRLLQLIGLMLASALLHNAVQLWPEVFAQLFPAGWIFEMQTIAQPFAVPFAPVLL